MGERKKHRISENDGEDRGDMQVPGQTQEQMDQRKKLRRRLGSSTLFL